MRSISIVDPQPEISMHDDSLAPKPSPWSHLRNFLRELAREVREHFERRQVWVDDRGRPLDMSNVIFVEKINVVVNRSTPDELRVSHERDVDEERTAIPRYLPTGMTLRGAQIPTSAEYGRISYDPIRHELQRGGQLALATNVDDAGMATFTNFSLPPGSNVRALDRENVAYDSVSPAGRLNMLSGAVVTFPDGRQTKIEGSCYVTPFGGAHINTDQVTKAALATAPVINTGLATQQRGPYSLN